MESIMNEIASQNKNKKFQETIRFFMVTNKNLGQSIASKAFQVHFEK